ncbi:MAG: hypothetical protein ACOYM3_22025 [Terrimicrobiaceae bacterium]
MNQGILGFRVFLENRLSISELKTGTQKDCGEEPIFHDIRYQMSTDSNAIMA